MNEEKKKNEEELLSEIKSLKRSNLWLTIFVIVTSVIYLYNVLAA